MRKLFPIAIAALLLVVLAACNPKDTTNPGDSCPSVGATQQINTYPNGHPTLVCTEETDNNGHKHLVWK